MKITVKRDLLIERQRNVVIRIGGGAAQAICPVCGESRFVGERVFQKLGKSPASAQAIYAQQRILTYGERYALLLNLLQQQFAQ